MSFTTPDGFSEFTAEFTVPSGKRLVIEQVTANSAVPAGQIVRFYSLRTTANGVFVFHTVPATFNGFVDFTACQNVRFYADGGSLVKISAPRNTSTGALQTSVSFSGYLVPAP